MRLSTRPHVCQFVAACMTTAMIPAILLAQDARDEVVPNPPPQQFSTDFTRDGAFLVTGGDAVRVYDARDGSLVQQQRPPWGTRSVACSPAQDDLFATSWGGAGEIRLMRVRESEPVRVLKSGFNVVIGLAFSPDGRILASAAIPSGGLDTFDGELKFWDVESGEMVRELVVPQLGLSGVAFSHDGGRFAYATLPKGRSGQSSVRVHNAGDWSHVRTIPVEPGLVRALAFVPGSDRLIISGGECVPVSERSCRPTGRIWTADSNSDAPAVLFETKQCHNFHSISLTPRGNHFATATATGRDSFDSAGRRAGWSLIAEIQMRTTETGEIIWNRDGEIGDPYGVTVAPDGKLVACCTGTKVLILNAQNGGMVTSIQLTK